MKRGTLATDFFTGILVQVQKKKIFQNVVVVTEDA